MTDSTSNHVSIDYDQYTELVEKHFVSVEECDIFNEALAHFGRVTLAIDARWDENGMHHAANDILGQAAESLVAAAAQCHYAHVLFNILAALDQAVKASAEAVPGAAARASAEASPAVTEEV